VTTTFFKFPRTPQLAWLASGEPRGDKVLSAEERTAFLAGRITVEEKIDGANIGLSVGSDRLLRVQSRGNFIKPGVHPQFGPLWPWLGSRKVVLVDALGKTRMLFGEWCFAVHTVRYDHLPDWFLGFDVYDRAAGRFWSTMRRDELLSTLGLTATPKIASGHFAFGELLEFLDQESQVGNDPMEGLYLRREESRWLTARAKLVRMEFSREMEGHWSRRRLVKNRLRVVRGDRFDRAMRPHSGAG